MRRFIKDFELENFNYRSGSLEFSCPKLELMLEKNGKAEGSFFIHRNSHKRLEGYIITNGARLECLTDYFRENENEIFYRFDAAGLDEGEVVKGDIAVISNHGEYSLPYVVSIQHARLESSLGAIKNLFHFTNLAKENWREAVRLFYTPEFTRIFQGSDRQYDAAYRGFSYLPGHEQNMDQFLIEIHKKQEITYTLEKESIFLKYMGQELEEQLTIIRNGWGYTCVRIEVDGDFIEVSNKELLEADFSMDRHDLRIRIKESCLHVGNNFGEVRICSCHDCIRVPIKAQRITDRKLVSGGNRQDKKQLVFKMMQDYLAFRLHKSKQEDWLDTVLGDVDRLILMGEREIVPHLYQAQVLITKGKIHEAQWVLDHVETVLDGGRDKSEIWCYYLYLTALCNSERTYVNDIKEELLSAHREAPDNWRISWLVLHLEEGYERSAAKKWLFLEEQYYRDCISPVLYIEAVALLEENTSLLKKLEGFELQILWFAARHHALTKDMVRQLHYLVNRTKNFSMRLYHILVAGYDTFPDEITLEAICMLLIKGNRNGEVYFKWFELGVGAGLRITLLYEYFMMSIPLGSAEKIPKMVLMYFAYQSSLEYQKNAMLYAKVWKERGEYPDLFQSYWASIEQFAIEQLKLGHMNKELAYLYKNILTPQMITPALGQKLIPVLFSHIIRIKDAGMKKVILIYVKKSGETVYPIVDQKAMVPIYGPDYKMFFEDGEGVRFTGEEFYLMEKLILPGRFVKEVLPYAGENLDFALYLSDHRETLTKLSAATVLMMQRIVESEEVLPGIKRELSMKLLHFYFEQDMQQLDVFLPKMQETGLNVRDRSDVIRYMIVREMYGNALTWIKQNGFDGLEPKVIVRLCSRMISREEQGEDDEFTQVIYYAYKKGKYDEAILKYLVDHFEGPIKEMRDIWKSAREFLVEVFPICEKMMEQMLFTGAYIADRMEVYADYRKGPADAKIEHAFLESCAFEYFVKNRIVEDELWKGIVRLYRRENNLHNVCALAFLKYYAAQKKDRNLEINTLAEKFLKDLLKENIYFSFFSEYQNILPDLARYTDRTVLEYQTDPESRVVLHYMIEREEEDSSCYHQEVMRNMYAGIFSRSFVLFFGECLQYYITEEVDRKEQLTESGSIHKSDIVAETSENRFSIINDIAIAKTLRDYDTFDGLAEEYYEKNYMTEHLFTIV